MADTKLTTTLTTTLALLDQFTSSLNSVPADGTVPPPNSPSPLPLLSTCAATLRAQITKLSLLIITPPFTPSAISTLLTSLNDAILPSLLTATLLLTPSTFTKAYSTEAISLTKATLRDLRSLIQLISTRSKDGKPKSEPRPPQQSAVTEATGKLWDHCDELKTLAENGISGFVVQKAEQYFELIKDAVKEIEEWDPGEDDEEDFGFDLDEVNKDTNTTSKPHDHHPDITTLKPHLLPLLLRVPQSLHVVIHQRLKKPPFHPTQSTLSTKQISLLDHMLSLMSQTSTIIDDVAERLYMHDGMGAVLTAEKARGCVVGVVERVVEPGWWDGGQKEKKGGGEEREDEDGGGSTATTKEKEIQTETKEDRYVKRALEWIKSAPLGAISQS